MAAGLLTWGFVDHSHRAGEANAATAIADKAEAELLAAPGVHAGPVASPRASALSSGIINSIDTPDIHIGPDGIARSVVTVRIAAAVGGVPSEEVVKLRLVGPDIRLDPDDLAHARVARFGYLGGDFRLLFDGTRDGRTLDSIGPDGQIAQRSEADDTFLLARYLIVFLVLASAGTVVSMVRALRGPVADRRARLAEFRPTLSRYAERQPDWADRVTVELVASAVYALTRPDDRTRYREEWSADLAEIPAGWQRLRWALSLHLHAPRGIRAARRGTPSTTPPRRL